MEEEDNMMRNEKKDKKYEHIPVCKQEEKFWRKWQECYEYLKLTTKSCFKKVN